MGALDGLTDVPMGHSAWWPREFIIGVIWKALKLERGGGGHVSDDMVLYKRLGS